MQFSLPELTLIIPAAENADFPVFRIDKPGKIFPVHQHAQGHSGGCHLIGDLPVFALEAGVETAVSAVGIAGHIFFKGESVELIIGSAAFRSEKEFHFVPCLGVIFIQPDGEHDPVFIAIHIEGGAAQIFYIRFGIGRGKFLLSVLTDGKGFDPFCLIFRSNRSKGYSHQQQQQNFFHRCKLLIIFLFSHPYAKHRNVWGSFQKPVFFYNIVQKSKKSNSFFGKTQMMCYISEKDSNNRQV